MRQWFDPTEDASSWTTAAAVATGLHASLAYVEADIEDIERLLAAIPAEYRGLAAVVHADFNVTLWIRADPARAEAMVARLVPRNDYDAHLCVLMAVQADVTRIRLGSGGGPPLETIRVAVAELVARARRSGDEIALFQALSADAQRHLYSGNVEAAYAAAAASISLAEAVHAEFYLDGGRVILARALAVAAAAGLREPARAAWDLREMIKESHERNDRLMVGPMLDAVAILIATLDPEVALLLSAVYERVLSVGSMLDSGTVDRLDSRRRAELGAEAARITFEEAVALAVAALDRHYPPA
jgi:hypothetical protein